MADGPEHLHQFIRCCTERSLIVARRKNKIETAVWGLLILIAAVGWVISKLLDTVGIVMPLLVILLAFAAIISHKAIRRKRRIQFLLDKYGNEEIVQRIMNQHFWQGQTAAQLLDSIGNPMGIDRKAMATRKREVWKYNSIGKNRYGLRITLDDDVVIGWDQKN